MTTTTALDSLRRFAAAPTLTRCDACGSPLGEPHAHLYDTLEGRLECVCDPCALLFPESGRETRRLRVVPSVRRLERGIDDDEWRSLGIPVGLACIVERHSAGEQRVRAMYPSVAGVVEADLDATRFRAIVDDHDELDSLLPEVRGLFVDRTSSTPRSFVLSIDLVFALVGLLRSKRVGAHAVDEALREFVSELDAGRVPRWEELSLP